ncbi:MAG: helix-hairpin-helix domain-containing protein [Sideroxydans sp.]|nr:helix-hairpin-helix domain-containing protein [Sideroxydans sp.]
MKKLILLVIALFALNGIAYANVDLNTATQEELQSVKGIGKKKAQAIVEYRQAHGNFKSVDELDNVKGFGKKSVKKLSKELTVAANPAPVATSKKKGAKPAAAKK